MNVTLNEQLFDEEFIQQLERLEILARKLFRGLVHGEHLNQKRGHGLEFTDYRCYQPGDDLRYIDWNLYSRLDQLFLKLYTSDEDLSLHLLLDCSASMGFGNPKKFNYARRLAAALGYVGLNNLDRVGVRAFSSEPTKRLPRLKSKRQMTSLLSFLESLECSESTEFTKAIDEFVSQKSNPGLVIVLTDLLGDEDLLAGMHTLSNTKHDLVLLHLLSEDEIDPPLDGPFKLIDIESQDVLSVTIDAGLRQHYIQSLNAYLSSLEQLCRSRRIEYLRASTSIPFEDLVITYLRQGKHWR